MCEFESVYVSLFVYLFIYLFKFLKCWLSCAINSIMVSPFLDPFSILTKEGAKHIINGRVKALIKSCKEDAIIKMDVLRASQRSKSGWHFLQGSFPRLSLPRSGFWWIWMAQWITVSLPSSTSLLSLWATNSSLHLGQVPDNSCRNSRPEWICRWNRINSSLLLGKQLLVYMLVTVA